MKKILLLLIIPFLSFGQCLKGDCVNGNGIYQYDGGVYEGDWNNNQRHGTGTMNWEDGNKFVGVWIKNKYDEGLFIYATGDRFNGKFNENGSLINGRYTYKNGQWEEGAFHEQNLVDGKIFYIADSGAECYTVIKDAAEIKTNCNNQNQYNPNDIVSGPKALIIDLIINDEINKTKDAFFVNLVINNNEIRFHFDTGCSTLNMNLSQWEELKPGLQYEDLQILSTGDAVGSIQSLKYYKILESIKVGGFAIKNVIVSVTQVRTPDKADNDNLIGIGFFNKFSNVIWDMNNKTIQLYK